MSKYKDITNDLLADYYGYTKRTLVNWSTGKFNERQKRLHEAITRHYALEELSKEKKIKFLLDEVLKEIGVIKDKKTQNFVQNYFRNGYNILGLIKGDEDE